MSSPSVPPPRRSETCVGTENPLLVLPCRSPRARTWRASCECFALCLASLHSSRWRRSWRSRRRMREGLQTPRPAPGGFPPPRETRAQKVPDRHTRGPCRRRRQRSRLLSLGSSFLLRRLRRGRGTARRRRTASGLLAPRGCGQIFGLLFSACGGRFHKAEVSSTALCNSTACGTLQPSKVAF